MSDTYDEMERFVEKTQRRGDAEGVKHSEDEDHPQQDFGRFSDMGHNELKKNSPENEEADPFREADNDGKCGG